ncbi:MAG: phage tail tape measure protein [Lachnospira pectinoschiza]
MPGTYQYDVEIKSNVAKLLSDMKQVQDRLDTVEGKEYKIKLNVDEKKLSSVISNLEKMLDSLGKGTGDFKQFENLSKELSSIVSEVQSLSKAFGKVDDSGTKTLLSSIQNIDKSLSELSQNILNVNKNMSNMSGNTSGAVKQVENISNAYQDAAKEAEKLADAQSKIGQKTNISSGNTNPPNPPKKDRYAKRRKISEEDFLNYSPNRINEKLSNSGYKILGETVNTELVDGLVKVSAKIKDADGAWKSFSAKVDADGNIFEQRFKTVTNGVDKLETALQNFGRETAPALTYQETLDKAQKIKNSLNLGDEYSIKVDSSEFVTITKKLTDVENAGSSVTQTFKSAQDAIDNFGKATSNSAEKTSVALKSVKSNVKEVVDETEKLANAQKEQNANVNLNKYDKQLDSYNGKVDKYQATIARFNDGGWTSDTYKQRVNAVKEAVAEYERILSSLKNNPDLVTEENLNKLNKQEKLIKDNITAVQNMSAAEKGYSLISAQKELDKINNILKEHSGMSREAKNQIKAYYTEIKSGNPSASLDVIHGKIMQIVNAEIEAGRGGKSMFDAIKEKAWYGVASAIGTYFGFNDLIRYGKEGVSIVRQLDTALTEMRKVSNESVQSLKKYQDTTFDTADAVGTTAKQIQNSTADWMRLGESMDTAAKSAKDANILFNVSEFEGIDEATESLVSMSQAYKDLDKMDIIDVLNNIGNNYSISTDGLATALKDSASALVTANNDLNEAVSLTTAGNAITQDPSKVGAGLRTISLRLVGTEEAKEELSDLGEETDGMITTVSKLRNTIQSATSAATKDGKGFDIFDSNGNYKSTYEIMQGLADLYDEIVKKDKELGTNNLNLLLETIAGKNRSNIAASILQNGDMLRSVYEDAQNSEGSAEKELNSYLDSVDGKFQQLQNRTQEFWYNVIDTTTVKSVLDFTTDLTEGASKFFKLVEKHLPTILGAIATIIASNKSGGLIRLINFINNSPFLATVEFNREVCELIV